MRKYEKSIIILFIWTIFQDFVLSILLSFTNNSTIVSLLFYTKDIMFIILFVISLSRNKYKPKVMFIFFIYFIFIAIQGIRSFISDISLVTILSSVRGWLIMPGFISIGMGIADKNEFLKFIKTKLLGLFVVVLLFGMLDYILDVYVMSTIPFWRDFINIGNYMTVIKGQGDRLFQNLPGNFYGQYGGAFFSQKRLVSFWGGPLTSAYVLCLPCIYLLVELLKRKNNYFLNKCFLLFGLTFLCIIFTYTRAIILPLCFVIFLMIFYKKKNIQIISFALMPIILIIIIINSNKILSYVYDASTIEHIRQTTSSFLTLGFMGKGLGIYGVNGTIGTESAYLTCWGELGFIAFLIYFCTHIYLCYYFARKSMTTKSSFFTSMFLISSIYLITGFISEQLIAFTSSCPFYILVGIAIGYKTNFNEYNLF